VPLLGNNSGQVVHTHVPLSPSSIIWYQPNRNALAPYPWSCRVSWCLAEELIKHRSAPPYGQYGSGKDFTLLTYYAYVLIWLVLMYLHDLYEALYSFCSWNKWSEMKCDQVLAAAVVRVRRS